MKFFVPFLGFLFLLSCKTIEKPSPEEKLNILWIVAEDLSPIIPSFGDSTIKTPNLSKLAAEGICYDRFFSPSGVCSPSRAAIATGMYPIHIGANHMRTGPWFPGIPQEFIDSYAQKAMPPDVIPYETVPPPEVKMMSELLRKAGYYCSNNSKEDYQFRKSLFAWDDSSNEAHWRNRAVNQPFFSVFNLGVTHESQIWSKANDSLWVESNLDVPVPPYLPKTDSSLIDIRRMYSNVKEMDAQVGKILSDLEEDGLLDKTIIFWYTDHGGPLPRQKRLTYDSGLRVPMIVRFPNGQSAGTRNGDLISFIDLAPTMFSLVGINPPKYLDGQAFLGPFEQMEKRNYIHAASDRFDESATDPIRAVRDKRFKYIRYYDQEKPMFYHVGYRDQMSIMRELYKLRDADELTETQELWFRENKPNEELFDTYNDPHEINDLAKNPDYAEVKRTLDKELDEWLHSIVDLNMMDEQDLIASFWPNGVRPVTEGVEFERVGNEVRLYSKTQGASIGYRVVTGVDNKDTWSIYTEPISLREGQRIVAVAHRLGYYPSPQDSSN